MTDLRTPLALTEAEALTAYRAVVAHLNDTYGEHLTAKAYPLRQGESDPAWYTGPVLVADFGLWDDPTRWAVVWEGSGIRDWPMSVPHDLTPGVSISAFAVCAVALSPAEPVELP